MEQEMRSGYEAARAAEAELQKGDDNEMIDCTVFGRIGSSHAYVGIPGKRVMTKEEKDGAVFIDYVEYVKNANGDVINSFPTRRQKTASDFANEQKWADVSAAEEDARQAARDALAGTDLEIGGDGEEYTSFTITITLKSS